MSYKSTRRQWVKLWVNEWLDGTTRFELTSSQRLLWVDLLALAGRSRFPGYIYAGTGQGNERVGYPIAYLAGVLQLDETDTNNALKLLALHGHITLEETTPEKFVIGIVNWEKYQSEYLRQKAYRKVTTKTTSRLPVEVEVEVEGDKKESKEESTPLAKTARERGLPGFELFWQAYPQKVKKPIALRAWLSKVRVDDDWPQVMAGLELWKSCEKWQTEPEFIPYPATFLNGMQWKDLPGAQNGQPISKADLMERRNVNAVAEAIRRRTGNLGGDREARPVLPPGHDE